MKVMKVAVGGILIFLGVASWAVFFLTFEKPACLAVCGCCPGLFGRNDDGNGVFASFFKNKFDKWITPRNSCSYVGCTPVEKKVIYVDLGILGVALTGVGLVMLVKRE